MHTILIRGYCHDFTALHIQLLFKMYKMGTTLEQNPWPFRTDCKRGLYWMNVSYESCRHSQVQVVSIAPCRRHIILP